MMLKRFVCGVAIGLPFGALAQDLPVAPESVNAGITAGQPISAEQMQQRFLTLVNAINELHGRVEALEGELADRDRLLAAQALIQGTQNLAFHQDPATGRFSIWCVAPEAEAGVAPCTEQNPGFVVMPSVRHGGLVRLKMSSDAHYFVDAQGASSLLGNSFNTEPRRPFDERRPFFLYAANRDDTDAGLRFGLTPHPAAARVPQYAVANAGTVGSRGQPATDNQAIDFVFLWEGRDELIAQFVNDDERPVMRIGSVEMVKVVRGQVDDWQVMPPRRGVGLGQYPWNRDYTLPAGAAVGTAEGSYFHADNGPVQCDRPYYRYRLSPDGLARIALNLDECSLGEPPQVELVLVTPYAGVVVREANGNLSRHLGTWYAATGMFGQELVGGYWSDSGRGLKFVRWTAEGGLDLSGRPLLVSEFVGAGTGLPIETTYRAFLD